MATPPMKIAMAMIIDPAWINPAFARPVSTPGIPYPRSPRAPAPAVMSLISTIDLLLLLCFSHLQSNLNEYYYFLSGVLMEVVFHLL